MPLEMFLGCVGFGCHVLVFVWGEILSLELEGVGCSREAVHTQRRRNVRHLRLSMDLKTLSPKTVINALV